MIESEENSVTEESDRSDLLCMTEASYEATLKMAGLTKEEFEKIVDVCHDDGLVYMSKKFRFKLENE
jgi:hypothetical protein